MALGSLPQFDLTTQLAAFLQQLQAAGGFPTLPATIAASVNLVNGGPAGQVLVSTGVGTPAAFSASGAVSTLSTVSRPGLGTTSTDGFLAQNLTASTAGVPVQISPRSRWVGTAWNSTALLSETDAFFAEVLPATVAGTTTATWKLGFQNGSGAITYPLIVSSSGSLSATNYVATAAGLFFWSTRAVFESAADGCVAIENNAQSLGSRLKADALPTVASGFGSSPSITAGSTPLAGSVNVGTGGVATSGVINFNGTAFPSAPYVVATTSLTNAVVRATASTTQLTLTSTTAWSASDVIAWHAISSK